MVYRLPALFGLVLVSYHLSFGCTLTLTLLVGIVTVVGTLKGYDQLMNLVLDDVKELLRGTSVPTLLAPPLPYGWCLYTCLSKPNRTQTNPTFRITFRRRRQRIVPLPWPHRRPWHSSRPHLAR